MVVTIGPSNVDIKTATVPSGYTCPSVVSKANWVGSDTYGDTFEITQSETSLSAKRTDQGANGNGWGMNLRITCTSTGMGLGLVVVGGGCGGGVCGVIVVGSVGG